MCVWMLLSKTTHKRAFKVYVYVYVYLNACSLEIKLTTSEILAQKNKLTIGTGNKYNNTITSYNFNYCSGEPVCTILLFTRNVPYTV